MVVEKHQKIKSVLWVNDSGSLTGASYRWDNVSWTSSGTVPYTNRNIGGDSNEDCSKALAVGGNSDGDASATLDDTTWTTSKIICLRIAICLVV